ARSAASYCALRGVETLIDIRGHPTDGELEEWAACISDLLAHGLTGVMASDPGVLRMAHIILPEMDVHVSIGAGVLTAREARQWASLGASRVWLAPQLSRERLAYILRHAGVPCGVTVAGEVCAGLPGHCGLGAARRGDCALACGHECAKPFGIDKKPEDTPLEPKAFSLHACVDDLRVMGADSFFIMDCARGPEWTSLTARIWSGVLDGKPPKQNDILLLTAGFHPRGLTDEPFVERGGRAPEPLESGPETVADIMSGLRASYENAPERQRVPVRFKCLVTAGQPVSVAVQDDLGHTVKVSGPRPSRGGPPLIEAEVNTRLYKLLGTPYRCVHARSRVDGGVSVPVSVIAELRNSALERLTQARQLDSARKPGKFHSGVKYLPRLKPPVLTMWVRRMSQLSPALAEQRPEVLYIPLMELRADAARLKPFLERGVTVCPWLPKGLGDHEQSGLNDALAFVAALGIKQAAASCAGDLPLLERYGISARADFPAYNSQALKELKRIGFKSALLSHGLTLRQLKESSHALDTELPVYGRMPLLLSDRCFMKSDKGLCNCDNLLALVDAAGARAPMLREYTCRTGIYSAIKLFMGHRLNELSDLGLWALRLCFTTENARECATVAERYNGTGNFSPGEYVEFERMDEA
ncbi:MAG: DUF3656 domain-containing protein, partial [Oscillospiraceae bacterium]|nr:DUF3656 domain-containing protein [Oscillospiraceae bacterium]